MAATERKAAANCPELLKAVLLARRRKWPLIIASLDRVSRNAAVFQKLIDGHDIRIVSATEDGPLDSATMLAKIAGAQRKGEEIGERTRKALQQRKSQGILLGNRKNLDEARRKAVETLRARTSERSQMLMPIFANLAQRGVTTAAAIAAELNRMGVPTRRGGMWTKDNVRRYLRLAKEQTRVANGPRSAREDRAIRASELWGSF